MDMTDWAIFELAIAAWAYAHCRHHQITILPAIPALIGAAGLYLAAQITGL